MVEPTSRKKTGTTLDFLPTWEERLKAQENPEMDPDIQDIGATSPENARLQDQDPEKADPGQINEFFPVSDPGPEKSIQKEAISIMGEKTEVEIGSGMTIVRYGPPGSEIVKLEVESDIYNNPVNLDDLPFQDLAKVKDWLSKEKSVKG